MCKMKNLVIVESPAKAKTIEKFLGPDYKVMSSYGHIRDLKSKSFSIDVDHDFAPIYEIPSDKERVVSELRQAASKADKVWLASDEDREGEAIAWHLAEVLHLDPNTTGRIVFHEITKKAILAALDNPRTIDRGRVDAQQARRVLDRIVGFELSPVLWRKIKPKLSAGRVQSVALRLIVEREKEIANFVSEPYFRMNGRFTTEGGAEVRGEYSHRVSTEAEARAVLERCAVKQFRVSEVTTRPVHKSPAPPFTTSTLQQEASRRLGFTVAQTMMVAQRLYEAGYITYMRTDSLNLSVEAVAAISTEITAKMGREYLHVRQYHTQSKGAQEAHEAIRPTDVSVETPAELTDRERRLYTLIRRRAIASQMADAETEKTTAEITNGNDVFTATGEVVKFDGYLRIYNYNTDYDPDDTESETSLLPALSAGQALSPVEISANQRFTQHPPRYSEATLVKKMEELGIGRPSTYAPTISTIQSRDYIEKGAREGVEREFISMRADASGKVVTTTHTEVVGNEKSKLVPTDVGMVVNDFLTEYFPEILDYNFTAQVEERFDEIAEGHAVWNDAIRSFYLKFHPQVAEAMNMRLEHKVGERLLGTDAEGHPVSVKIGRYGPLVQIGDGEGEEKPRFASLLKGQSISEITLEEALRLFDFPRDLGEFEGHDVTVAIGRFGPYVRHNNKFVSIPKDIAPTELTLSQAITLIVEKRSAEANRVVKTFDGHPEIQVLNGRYGIYIAANGKNYKIPKDYTPTDLSIDQVLEIIDKQDKQPAKPRRAKK